MTNNKLWKIECSQGMKVLFLTKIPVNHIREIALEKLLNQLLSRHALTDEEVIESFITIPFKKKINYFNITRHQDLINGKVKIAYTGGVSSISVTATLIEENIS